MLLIAIFKDQNRKDNDSYFAKLMLPAGHTFTRPFPRSSKDRQDTTLIFIIIFPRVAPPKFGFGCA